MARLNRLSSFLDRFEAQLEVDCEKLKHELADRVDRQFGVMRTKVREVKNRFDARPGNVRFSTDRVSQLTDDPEMETVSLEEWLQDKRVAKEHQQNMPSSTLSGRKRASESQAQSTTPKKRKSNASDINGTKKLACKFEGCERSFQFELHLVMHEHMHLGIKPFSCTWPNCGYSCEQRSRVVVHVRIKHFKLPNSQKEQHRLNIVDDRDPNEYIQVDTQLVQLRLE